MPALIQGTREFNLENRQCTCGTSRTKTKTKMTHAKQSAVLFFECVAIQRQLSGAVVRIELMFFKIFDILYFAITFAANKAMRVKYSLAVGNSNAIMFAALFTKERKKN